MSNFLLWCNKTRVKFCQVNFLPVSILWLYNVSKVDVELNFVKSKFHHFCPIYPQCHITWERICAPNLPQIKFNLSTFSVHCTTNLQLSYVTKNKKAFFWFFFAKSPTISPQLSAMCCPTVIITTPRVWTISFYCLKKKEIVLKSVINSFTFL